MRRSTLQILAVALVVVAVAACGNSSTNAGRGVSGPPAPPPPPGRISPAPLMTTEGSRIACGLLPVAGQGLYNVHDCWIVQLDSAHDQAVLGGFDTDVSDQGILIVDRADSHHQSVYRTPTRTGDVTVTLARWAFVCFTTARGGVGEFIVDTWTFTSQAKARQDCPAG